MSLPREIAALEARLKAAPQSFTSADYKRLYDLTGQYLSSLENLKPGENPCSMLSITKAVQAAVVETLSPCRILSLGTGGYPYLDLPLIQKGFTLVGSDFSFSLTKSAQKIAIEQKLYFPQVNLDGQDLSFRSESFDACICSETVEHIPDDRKVISEIHRILKPGGTLILTVPNLWAAVGVCERTRCFFRSGSWVTHQNHLREYSYFSARKLVQEFFRVEKWFSVPFCTASFKEMPYHTAMSSLVRFPVFRFFSLSIGFVLRKK